MTSGRVFALIGSFAYSLFFTVEKWLKAFLSTLSYVLCVPVFVKRRKKPIHVFA
jgi:hypothetical protein